jgi:hypothetical protein
MAPDRLRSTLGDHGRIQGSTATFGAPYFGDRVLGMVHYGPGQSGQAPHCTVDDYEKDFCSEESSGKEGETKLINVLLLRRGGCSFVTKVKIAQQKCAHAVIIVDKESSNLTDADMRNIIVADDGYGDKIRIPSVLISKEKGQKLIDEVQRGGEVVAELAWDIPTGKTVNVDMWISSASRESLRFLKEFAPKRRVLNSVISFTPHYAVFGMESGSPGIFNDLCWSTEGKYCAEDPDGAGPITGRHVLEEDLRQLCIHEIYKKVSAEGKVDYSPQFWDYIEKFGDKCTLDGEGGNQFGEACSLAVMREANIDVNRIGSCLSETKDKKLQEQREHPAWSPRAVRINGWRYTGMLEPELVTRAICSGFIKAPQECSDLLAARDPLVPYQPGAAMVGGGGVTFGELMGWLFLTLVLAFGALLVYKRYLKKEMRITLREEVMLEVRNAMGEYRQMQG